MSDHPFQRSIYHVSPLRGISPFHKYLSPFLPSSVLWPMLFPVTRVISMKGPFNRAASPLTAIIVVFSRCCSPHHGDPIPHTLTSWTLPISLKIPHGVSPKIANNLNMDTTVHCWSHTIYPHGPHPYPRNFLMGSHETPCSKVANLYPHFTRVQHIRACRGLQRVQENQRLWWLSGI